MSTPSCSDWPVPPGLTLDNDASWSTIAPSQRKFEAREAVFLFPASSADRLFCISRGDLASGTFQMTQSDQVDADCVSMKVIIEYYPAHVFDLVKVCELKRKENQYGIGILVRFCLIGRFKCLLGVLYRREDGLPVSPVHTSKLKWWLRCQNPEPTY